MTDESEIKSRAKSYCFTVNNWTQADYDALVGMKYDYLIIGKEVGASGTPHLQCFMHYNNKISFNTLKKKLPRAHIEVCKGTALANISYCSKDGDFAEFGERPKGQGHRSDIDTVRQIVKETGKMREVVLQATSYQSVKMAEQILKYHEPKRDWKPRVEWFHGATGTGKSKMAYEILGNDCYTCLSTGRWFDGYDAHENVLIDDMRGDFMKFHELLRMLDRYAFTVETKGGTRQFLARHIIITSCYHPADMYNTREDIGQLLRRIDEIKDFNLLNDIKNNI